METSSFFHHPENPSSPAVFPAFFLLFFAVYLVGYFLVFRSWSSPYRSEASSSFMSLFHGTPAVVMASHVIFKSSLASASSSFASPNTAAETAVLDFSTAYFTVDLLHYLVFNPHDVLFILHHVATLYVFITCRLAVCHGAHALLLLLVLAEATSACQNVWSIAGYRKNDVILAKKVWDFLSPPFYVFYTVVRGLAGPVVLYEMAAFYGSGAAEGSVPRWACLSWLVVIGAAILVSILWILGNWADWFRKRKFNSTKKHMKTK